MWSFYFLAFFPTPSSVPTNLLIMAEAEQKGPILGPQWTGLDLMSLALLSPFLFGNDQVYH